jgi:hypothetical protein
MQLMKEGAKWELYIPSELGYGDQGAGGVIPGGAVLVFTLELLKVRANFWFGCGYCVVLKILALNLLLLFLTGQRRLCQGRLVS